MTPASITLQAAAARIELNDALITGGRIALIAALAVLIRYLLHRAVRRMTKRSIEGKMPVMLRGVKGRARNLIVNATGLEDERRRQRAETIRSVLQSVISITVFTIAVILILGELGVNLAPIVASAGIAGVALGFGAQNLVKDYLNGICMILEDQYGVGDLVDFGDVIGTVEAVSLRTTRVRDVQGVTWYVRNGEVLRVANQSQGTASIVVDFPIAHDSDLELAKREMLRALTEYADSDEGKKVLLAPPEMLGVQSVTPIGITLRATLTAAPSERYRLGRLVNQRVSEALKAAGISTPRVPFGADPQ